MIPRLAALAAVAALWCWPLTASEQLVVDVQSALNRLGYDAGIEDGRDGRRTQEAIRAFQEEFARTPDGIASPELLKALETKIAEGEAAPERALARAGLLRAYTRAVQEALISRGHDPGPVDGLVGRRTRAGVRAYQQANGLVVDGTISPALLAHLWDLDGGAGP